MRALLTALLLLCAASAVAQVPAACEQYRTQITRSAYRTFGPSAPVADLAAQVQQESGCRADARSRVGAQGLKQFMPATGSDMALRYAELCAPANPFNADWSIKCGDRYMQELLARFPEAATESDQWAFAFSSYNGGATWAERDQRICRIGDWEAFPCEPCNERRWWDNVERTPDTRRKPSNVRENRGYPQRIMCVLAPRYEAAGWGRAVGCPQ